MTGTVSVIIPVHNGERYLGEAIHSALGQTHSPSEIIVVDNGSTDRSLAVAEGFGRSVALIAEPALGPGRARNAGARVAHGEFIAFLDADDLWEASKLARQIEIFDAQPELDIVFTRAKEFLTPELTDAETEGLSCRPDAFEGIYSSTMLVRNRSFFAVGPFPELPLGEFIAWYGLAEAAGMRWRTIPDELVKRRVHLNNMSRRSPQGKLGYVHAAKIVLDSRRARNRQRDAE